MKNLLLAVSSLIIIFSCSKSKTEMNITGHIKDLRKGTVFLQKMEDTLLVTLDSVIITGNKTFVFSETVSSPEIYYLVVKIEDGTLLDNRIAFFGEASEITIHTKLKEFATKAIIKGSKNQDKLQEYYKLMDRYSAKNLELIEENLEILKIKNDSLITEIDKKQKALLRSRYLATINFAIQNKDLELAPFLMVNQVNNVSKKYLDTVYQSLNPKIKDSKYGNALESLIISKK